MELGLLLQGLWVVTLTPLKGSPRMVHLRKIISAFRQVEVLCSLLRLVSRQQHKGLLHRGILLTISLKLQPAVPS